MKFRKIPVVVEAIEISSILEIALKGEALPQWVQDAIHRGDLYLASYSVTIHTLEGNMTGNYDDWLVRGIHGELYPCKPDIFAKTFEPVSD